MIRAVLCIGLSVLTLAIGLWTAGLQSDNHERGLALNDLKERCSMIEAINGDQAAQVLRCDSAPLPFEPKPVLHPPAAPTRAPQDASSIVKLSARAAQSHGVAP